MKEFQRKWFWMMGYCKEMQIPPALGIEQRKHWEIIKTL